MISAYKEKEVSRKMHLTTLTPVGRYGYKGKYNLYIMDTTDKVLVVFGDQESLLNHINENLNHPFVLRFLHKTNNKYRYSVQVAEDKWLDVITIASAQAISVPTRKKCNISISERGGITIE